MLRVLLLLLALLAPQIASSVENARLYQELAKREQSLDHDIKAARNLQSVLLLREAPKIKGLDLSLFQFDWRQTWTVFLMNAERAIAAGVTVARRGSFGNGWLDGWITIRAILMITRSNS